MKTIKQLLTDLTLASWTRSSDCNDIIQKIIESADKLTDQNSKLTEAFEILAAAHKIEISTNVILKKDAEKSKHEIDNLRTRVYDLRLESDDLQAQNKELKEKNEQLQREKDFYKVPINSKHQQTRELKTQVEELTKQNSEFKEANELLGKRIKFLSEEEDRLLKHFNEYSYKHLGWQKGVDGLRIHPFVYAPDAINPNHEQLFVEEAQARELIDSLKSEIASKDKKVSHLEDERKYYQEQLLKYYGIEEKKNLEIDTLNTQIVSLKKENEEYGYKLDSVKVGDHGLKVTGFVHKSNWMASWMYVSNSIVTEQIAALKKQITDLEKVIADLKGEKIVRDFLASSVNEKDEMRALRKKINDLENHNDDLIAKIDRLCGYASEWNKKEKELQSQIASCMQSICDREKLNQKLEVENLTLKTKLSNSGKWWR